MGVGGGVKMTLSTFLHVRNENDRPYNDLIYLKANHLAYMEPRWYKSQISADCQQNLLSLRHNTSRFLLIIFLKEQKREDDIQGRQP